MWEIGTDDNEHDFSIYLLLHYLLADKILSVGRCHKVIIAIYTRVCIRTYSLWLWQVQKYWFPENEIKKRYPQIQGFFSVSSFTGEVNALVLPVNIITNSQ